MAHVTPQTAAALKAAGFPQPEPKFGQSWFAPAISRGKRGLKSVYDGVYHHLLCLHCQPGSVHVVGAFASKIFEAMPEDFVFAPTATDILAHIQLQIGEHRNVEFYCPTVEHKNFDALVSIGSRAFSGRSENPAEAAASLYLQLSAAT